MNHMLKSALGAGLAAAVTAGLTACGGSSSSSGSSASTVSVTGVVTDPAISGAQVRIDNSAGNALASVVVTDDNGAFSFSGISASALDGAVITASGGEDAETGVDFTGLQLKGIYQDDGSAEVVTPLTTLIVEEMEASGSDYATARATVATLLGLEESQLEADPDTDSAVQKLSLQLSLLGAALRAADGFDHVYELLENENGTDWTAISSYVQASDDYSDTIKERVAKLEEELTAIGSISSSLSAAELVTEANRLSFITGVSEFLEDYLSYTAAEGSDGETNIQTLAEALWSANGQKGLSTDSAKFANLVRYVFNVAGITTDDLDSSAFSLSDDVLSNIASIAELDAINHKIPLADGEYLTSSEAKREYFYASDLSPYYRAERIFDGVLDDAVTDDLYLSLAKVMATNSQIDELNVVIKTQIANPLNQANAAQNAGDIFFEMGNTTQALYYFDLSWSIYQPVLESIGTDNITKDAASFLQELSGSYRDADELEKASEVLDPLNTYIDSVKGTYSSTYAQILTAYGKQAAGLVEAAVEDSLSGVSVNRALETIDLYTELADGIGYLNTNICYMLKGSAYVSITDYYRQLEMADEVRSSIAKFIDLRENNDCANTAYRTDTYVEDLAPSYAYIDDLDGYEELIQTITYERYIEPAEAAILVYQAVALAKGGDTESAIQLILDEYPEDTVDDLNSQLTWLTNNGINRADGASYLALRLLKDGYIDEGDQVLDKAWEIATSETYNSSDNMGAEELKYALSFAQGCPKVAQLTYDYVDQSLGQERMSECINVATEYLSGTAVDAYVAYTRLMSALLETGMESEALNQYAQLISILNELDLTAYIEATRYALNYILESGAVEAGLSLQDLSDLQDSQITQLNSVIAQAADEDAYDDVVELAESVSTSYNEIASGLQNRTIATGLSNSDLKDQILDLRAAVYDVISLAQPSADKMAKASNITAAYKAFAGALSNARYYDEALALRDLDLFSGSDANTLREIVSDALVAEDDFTGLDIAARDIDLDGMPDFFEASAAEDDILNSGAVMDNDSDSDGYNDSEDTTPFYCEACAG